MIHAGGPAGEPRAAALPARHGYVEVRRLSEMRVEFDPPEPPAAPQDSEIRTLSAGEEGAVCACMCQAFSDHWGEGFPSERDWIHDRVTGRADLDPDLWRSAWQGSQRAARSSACGARFAAALRVGGDGRSEALRNIGEGAAAGA